MNYEGTLFFVGLNIKNERTHTLVRQLGAPARRDDWPEGIGPSARLNLGDCYSYALASLTRAPLLFKGGDFAHTDLRAAVAQPGSRSDGAS